VKREGRPSVRLCGEQEPKYLIEVKTNERTHFPLRRYVLEVR